MKENTLLLKKHVLLYDDNTNNLEEQLKNEFNYIKMNFCGNVFSDITTFNNQTLSPDTIVYLCGNITQMYNDLQNSKNIKINKPLIYVIKELSINYDTKSENYQIKSCGEVPINVHNVAVYFRNFFDSNTNYFKEISTEHEFQTLTESNKISNAFRKGIYLTNVEKQNDEIRFNLLRCSSNLNGPTENFCETDHKVISETNKICKYFFENPADLNHVLAQIYTNKIEPNEKEKKARISSHSDKTKDMYDNGLIAFCTFYDNNTNNESKQIKQSTTNMFDYCYNDTTVFTRLHFKLKQMVTDTTLAKEFSVTLYPNSVLVIPLSTNRLYQHEIRPSILSIDKIPTRMGYVIRCSKTRAVFKNNETYIDEDGKYIKLRQPNDDDINELRKLYLEENITTNLINYPKIYFSMNGGDYMEPVL